MDNIIFNVDATNNDIIFLTKNIYKAVFSPNTKPFIVSENWLIGEIDFYHKLITLDKLNILGASLAMYRSEVIVHWGTYIYILFDYTSNDTNLSIRIISPALLSKEEVTEITSYIKQHFPTVQTKAEDVMPVYFSSWSRERLSVIRREITIQFWEDIQSNYAPSTKDKLDNLMNDFKPARGGQLILWHGNPGTGKTFSIRALTKKWSSWCDFFYVLDPEVFFGHAPYMLELITNQNYEEDDYYPYRIGASNIDIKSKKKWKLLILEDAGELICEDARDKTGQGLSRLLNIVDGLIGQGLQILILITTNEPLGSLHPAVARSGRCASETYFVNFEYPEAIQWLKNYNVDTSSLPHTAHSLADLYGIKEGYEKIVTNKTPPKHKVGF